MVESDNPDTLVVTTVLAVGMLTVPEAASVAPGGAVPALICVGVGTPVPCTRTI